MSRPGKGPFLWKKPAEVRSDGGTRSAVWVIKDGAIRRSTGIRAEDGRKTPPEEAQQALADYISEKYQPAREQGRSSASIPIADVISIYLSDKADSQARPKEVAGRAERLLGWWGDKLLSQVTGANCRAYAEYRNAPGAARRELEDLRSAIRYHRQEGLCREVIEVTLPEKGNPRERWLTRSEAAKLIWAAWQYREIQKGEKTGRRSRQHVARFILVALYTGTRAGAVCSASLEPTGGQGWVNLETGIFYRRPSGERETKKRRPPVRLSTRLISHLRRWNKNKQKYAVEFNGKPVKDVDKAFRACVSDARLGNGVSPHTLRHTAATWLMQKGVDLASAASLLGMTVQTLERVYWHHHPDYQVQAAEALSRGPSADRNSANKSEQASLNETKIIDFARVS